MKAIQPMQIVNVEAEPMSGVQLKDDSARALRLTEPAPASLPIPLVRAIAALDEAPESQHPGGTIAMAAVTGCDLWLRMQARGLMNKSTQGRYRLCSDGVYRFAGRAVRG